MEKMFEMARKFRLFIFIITIGAISAVNISDAFWPPDLIPHGPELPEPTKYPDDHISGK